MLEGSDGAPRRRGGPLGALKACCDKVLSVLDMTSLQTVQYLLFLYVFQTLVTTFNTPNARWFTKYIEDTFTDNTFDSSHNAFSHIRRTSDIYEWMNTVGAVEPKQHRQGSLARVAPLR